MFPDVGELSGTRVEVMASRELQNLALLIEDCAKWIHLTQVQTWYCLLRLACDQLSEHAGVLGSLYLPCGKGLR